MKLKIDKELRDLLPPLTPDEYEKLEQSILKIGLQDTIKVWDGYIIDGHNRYSICKKHNIPISKNDVVELKLETKQQAIRWMLSYQLGRRNLSEYQRYEIVQKYKDYFIAKAKQNNSDAGKGLTTLSKVNTRKEMAKMARVSEGTYQKLDKISKSGNEELKKKVKNKEVSINKAYKEVIKPKKEETIEPKKETVSDCEKKIQSLNAEIKKIEHEREQMEIKKILLFDETNTLIKCECEYELGLYFSNVDFFIIYDDGVKKDVGRIDNNAFENYLESKMKNLSFKLNNVEKKVFYEKVMEIKCDFLAQHKKYNDDYIKSISNNSTKVRTKEDEEEILFAKEIISAGYKALAKKYHPDNGGNAEKFKDLKELKEDLLQLVENI